MRNEAQDAKSIQVQARSNIVKLALLVSVAGIGANLTSCAPARSGRGPQDVVQAIIDADNAGDLDAVADCYTCDVVWVPPNGALVVGRAAICQRYSEMYSQFDARISVRYEEIETGKTLAFVRGVTEGELAPRNGGDAQRVRDRFLAVLRLDDGEWRVARLMWTAVK